MWAFHLNRDLAVLQICVYFSCLKKSSGAEYLTWREMNEVNFPWTLVYCLSLICFLRITDLETRKW